MVGHVKWLSLTYQRVGLPGKVGKHVLLCAWQLLPHLLVHTKLSKVSNIGWNL